MSTEQHDIEKRIKESFENHDFEIQDAWLEDLSTKLDDFNKEPKRKFGFWIFLLGGLLLGSAVGGYWYANSSFSQTKQIADAETINEVAQEKNAFENSEHEISSPFYTQEKCDEETVKENYAAEYTDKLEANTKVASKENTENGLKKQKNATNNNSFNENTLNENTNAGISKKTAQNNIAPLANSLLANNNTTQTNLENSSYQTQEINSNKNTVSSLKTTETKVFSQEKDVLSEESENKNEKILKEENTLNLEMKTENKNSENNLTPETKNQELQTNVSKAAAIDSLKEAVLEDKITAAAKDSLVLKNEKEEEKPKAKNKDLGLSLALNAGPSFLFRSFNSTTQNEKRTTEEKNKIGWNANLEIYKTFANKIIIGTGIQAANYGEKIAYTQINTTVLDSSYTVVPKDYLNLKISRTIDSFGQRVYSFDTTAIVYNDSTLIVKDSLYENTAVTKSNKNTQFTYIEIPVLFGYKILDTKKFDIIATTGVSVGFLLQSCGVYISEGEQLEAASNTKINFNYLLNAQFNYQVYKNLSLSLAPNFRYSINNQSRLIGTQKRYASFGLNTGVVLDF